MFAFKFALNLVEREGLTLSIVAPLLGVSPSWLYELNGIYQQQGLKGVSPRLARVLPQALDLDIFDMEKIGARPGN